MLIETVWQAVCSIFAGVQRRMESAAAARRFIATQLDPLLKAADELQGKLRSLAEEDFVEFRDIHHPTFSLRTS